MKLKKLGLFLILMLTSHVIFAYTVYNQTKQDIFIRDIYGLRGLSATIPKGGQISCNESKGGCSGKLWLYIYPSNHEFQVLCSWSGKIDAKAGTVFLIKQEPGKTFPSDSWCKFDYHHVS